MWVQLSAVLPLLQLATALKPISKLQSQKEAAKMAKRDIDPSKLYPTQTINMPIDHFHNESKYAPHSNGMFKVRYWFDDTYYKPGGPVYVLHGGETDATGRLEYLQKGILYELSRHTGGMGVVFEHRYYGESYPTPNLSVENLRFLTTEQALADYAYFAQNVVFAGHEHTNLTSHTTPYIAYGGSYAGALAAFVRTTYPDTYWGAISSSGVTNAIYDYWQYYEPVTQYFSPQCIAATKQITHAIDTISSQPAKNAQLIKDIKNVFGLEGVQDYRDALNVITSGVQGLQSLSWIPSESVPTLPEFCGNMSTNTVLTPSTTQYKATVQNILKAGGYGGSLHNLTNPFLNWISYNNINNIVPCAKSGEDTNACFTTQNATFYALDSNEESVWRSWPWQYCNEYGFLQTGSGVPKDQLPVISRLIDLPYEATVCREAFNITRPANVEIVNKYGGAGICYPRLAVIGGEWDPWRPSTPLADDAPRRPNTNDEPSLIIPKAVHHWDEFGVFQNETTPSYPPATIKQIHSQEVNFVKVWLQEWKNQHHTH